MEDYLSKLELIQLLVIHLNWMAQKIKKVVKTTSAVNYKEPKLKNPRIQIFWVDSELKEEEILQCIFKHDIFKINNFNKITLKHIIFNMKCRFQTKQKENGLCNWTIECSPEIRDELVARRRIYVDFSYCKVIDYLSVTRCFKPSHVTKHCEKKLLHVLPLWRRRT